MNEPAAVSPCFGLTTPPPKKKSHAFSDRLVPSRAASNLVSGLSLLDENADTANTSTEEKTAYDQLLRRGLLGLSPGSERAGLASLENSNLFRYARCHTSPVAGDTSILTPMKLNGRPARTSRKIPRHPVRVLAADGLPDDFYLNVLDWSSADVVAVGLRNSVFLWSASTGTAGVTRLCSLASDEGDWPASVGWTQSGGHLAVGTRSGEVQIWDVERERKLRQMTGHKGRCASIAWNSYILSTGGRDGKVFQRDVRVPEHHQATLRGHSQEVCGVKWSYDQQHIASGGNDGRVCVWDWRVSSMGEQSDRPLWKFEEHTAAVKALAWSPHQRGLLMSGGGTQDKCLRTWNTSVGKQASCIHTGSQVCNLVWSKNTNEVVTTHGYSQYEIIIWRHPAMSKVAVLDGHVSRVLQLAMSPDGRSIVTAAGGCDETLRFWNVFPGTRACSKPMARSLLQTIR